MKWFRKKQATSTSERSEPVEQRRFPAGVFSKLQKRGGDSKCPVATRPLHIKKAAETGFQFCSIATTTTTTESSASDSFQVAPACKTYSSRRPPMGHGERKPTNSRWMLTPNSRKELGYLNVDYSSLNGMPIKGNSRKPVLFVEAGDRAAGLEIFSNPLLVEAAALCFTTVTQAPDHWDHSQPATASFKSYRTRIRFLCLESRADLSPSVHGNSLSLGNVAHGMIEALRASRLPVPTFLKLLDEEFVGKLDTAVFLVSDSSQAEVQLAGLEGVVRTTVGTIEKKSVLHVSLDRNRLCFGGLVRFVLQHVEGSNCFYCRNNEECRSAEIESARYQKERICKTELYNDTMQVAMNPKKFLRNTPLRFVPLTSLQATRMNRLISLGSFDQAVHLLSPHQGEILMEAMRTPKSFHEVVDVALVQAWQSVCSQAHPSDSQEERESKSYMEELYSTELDESDMHARFL